MPVRRNIGGKKLINHRRSNPGDGNPGDGGGKGKEGSTSHSSLSNDFCLQVENQIL